MNSVSDLKKIKKVYLKRVLPCNIEMFYLISAFNFGIPPVLVFQLEVCYRVDRLLSGITAQQKGTTARWYSNKTSLIHSEMEVNFKLILNRVHLAFLTTW